jgi:hypothetical protein
MLLSGITKKAVPDKFAGRLGVGQLGTRQHRRISISAWVTLADQS